MSLGLLWRLLAHGYPVSDVVERSDDVVFRVVWLGDAGKFVGKLQWRSGLLRTCRA